MLANASIIVAALLISPILYLLLFTVVCLTCIAVITAKIGDAWDSAIADLLDAQTDQIVNDAKDK